VNRYDYFYRQVVTEAELDAGFTAAEDADHALAVDNGLFGIAAGMSVTQHGAGDMTVDVSLGSAYDNLGQRIRIPTNQNCDLSEDHTGTPTEVLGAGNERWVSLFVKFKRVESDPRVDGHGTTIQYSRAEGWEFYVTMGAEAVIPTATKPALETDGVLLADVHLTTTPDTILTADINMVTALYPLWRRQHVAVFSLVHRYLAQVGFGQWPAAFIGVANVLDDHFGGLGYKHHPTDIIFDEDVIPTAGGGAKRLGDATHEWDIYAQAIEAHGNIRATLGYIESDSDLEIPGVPQTLHRRNTPLAWGQFTGSDPAVLATPHFNVLSVVRGFAGIYTVTLDLGSAAALCPIAIAKGNVVKHIAVNPLTSSTFVIYAFNAAGVAEDTDIAFIVFGG
jgi:hypothetical protein